MILEEFIIPVLVSAIVGGLIGIEREYRDKSAGFRTMILISVGSTIFTLVSTIMGSEDGESSRIAAAVVSGIGFLGAGVILKDGITIRGLTTAASIWVVSALGMLSGVEEYEMVANITALVLFVLWFLPPIERWLDKLYEFPELHITIKNTAKAEEKIMDILYEERVKIVQVQRTRVTKGERILHIKIKCSLAKYSELSEIFVSEKSVLVFEG